MSRYSPRINFAIDTNAEGDQLIKADRAEHNPNKGRYLCLDPHCSTSLTVARSKRGRQHFKHFRQRQSEGCRFRTTTGIHAEAQHLLSAIFERMIMGMTTAPLMVFNTTAGKRECLPLFLSSCDNVVEEWICPKTSRRVDIALLNKSGEPLLLIEVHHTHKVDAAKRKDLGRHRWIEVEATDVLLDCNTLKVRNFGNLSKELALTGEQLDLF